MRVQLFTFRYSASLGGFDDEPLRRFIRDKEVVAFREHFFCVNEVPHLACVLVWQDAVVTSDEIAASRACGDGDTGRRTASSSVQAKRRDGRPDPTAGLDETDRALFNTLREWRSRKAHEEGVPPYLVFTNRHLVEIVRRKPENTTALSHVDGVGPGKVKRYGQDLLALIGPGERARPPSPVATDARADAPADEGALEEVAP